MEEEERESVTVEGSEGDTEEGECSSDGEESFCNLLGIPVDIKDEAEIADKMDSLDETGSEGEEEESEKERDGDRIGPEKLMELGSSEVLKGMLCNQHLRQLLRDIQESHDPQHSVQRAMNIPVFVEFADECLKICGFHGDQRYGPSHTQGGH